MVTNWNRPNAKPISPTMPHTIATKFKTATSSLSHELAKPLKWGLDTHSDINVSSFHVTKLMGGLRVYWNGKSQLMTLNGNLLSAPKAFLDSLPKFPVDAELQYVLDALLINTAAVVPIPILRYPNYCGRKIGGRYLCMSWICRPRQKLLK